MSNFVARGFGRALLPCRSQASSVIQQSNQVEVSSTAEVIESTLSNQYTIVPNYLWLIRQKSEDGHLFGLKSVPNMWKKMGIEDAEVTREIFNQIKTGTLTMRESFFLTLFGVKAMVIFSVGEMIGRWKIFGYRGQLPHHGHGLFTGDTPVHH